MNDPNCVENWDAWQNSYPAAWCYTCKRPRQHCGCHPPVECQPTPVYWMERGCAPSCPPPIPNPADCQLPNIGGWLPRNWNFAGINLAGDQPLQVLTSIFTDGLYQLLIAATTTIADAGAANPFYPTISFTQISAGPTDMTAAIDLTTAGSRACNTAISIGAVADAYQLAAGSVVTIKALGSLLTTGRYSIFGSVLRLA